MCLPLRSLTANLAFVAVIAAFVFLVVPLLQQLPKWAELPLLILMTGVACYVVMLVVRWRRSRTDGAGILADATVPLDQQTGYSKHYASPDRRFVAVTTMHNVRMDIWIDELLLCDVQRNQWILHVPHPYSVTDVAWGPGNRLRFGLNRYPDGGTWLNMVLDLDARMAEVGGAGEPATVTFARLVAWLNGFYAGSPLKRFFDTSAPGTLALPGARSSRIFTLSMVLLVLVPIGAVIIDARREALDDAGPVRVGGPINPPTQVRDVRPAYPPSAIQARVQGVVGLELTIAPDGSVIDAEVIRSIPLLDAAAIAAARQWQYTPTLVNGEPIPVRMIVPVQFKLPNAGRSE